MFGGQGTDILYGSDGDDRLSGDLGSDGESGGLGNDIVEGGSGFDTLTGEDGNDFVFGNQDNDRLSGGPGNDLLRGGQGNDHLYGDDGNDLIFGDLGRDTLAGGQGDDSFAFDAAPAGSASNPSPVTEPDEITDFDFSGGVFDQQAADRLELGAPANGANFLNSTQSVATLADAAVVAGNAMNGTVIYVSVNVQTGFGSTTDNTVVFWDANADGTPDEAIVLIGFRQVFLGPEDII